MARGQDATHDPVERIRRELAEARDRLAEAEAAQDGFLTGFYRSRVEMLEARLLRLTTGRWELETLE